MSEVQKVAELAKCQYRQPFSNSVQYFRCRHSKVHAAGDIVDPAICKSCNMREVPCPNPRPFVENSILKVPLPFGEVQLDFITVEQLVGDVRKLATQLPNNIGAVAGIPRSGMLPASLLASYLHVPLYELSAENGLHRLDCGIRLDAHRGLRGPLLVIDDSVASGNAMRIARRIVKQCDPRCDTIFAAVYQTPNADASVDFVGRVVPSPHLFEWNLFNCSYTHSFAFDLDGVLCDDWGGGDENGREYQDFLQNAKPRWLPRRGPVRLIVTARLEKHRESTMRWLTRHGISVQRLIMGPWNSVDERRMHYSAAKHKGQAFAESDCWLFIESDEQQAAAIYAATGKPVLCALSGVIFQ